MCKVQQEIFLYIIEIIDMQVEVFNNLLDLLRLLQTWAKCVEVDFTIQFYTR